MYRAKIIVTIEEAGQPVRLRVWTGRSSAKIKSAAKKCYPNAWLGFGRVMWERL